MASAWRVVSPMVHRERGYFASLLWANKFPTAVYCAVFWSFGMCVGFLGPTLWDLGCQTATVLPTMTWIFLCQSLFILVGSMLAGMVISSLSAHAVLLAGMVGIGATLAALPLCTHIWALAVVLALMGFSMGLIDTTANVSMIGVFGVDVSPFLQALHFFYGLGAFISPMIAEPFLQNYDCTSLIDNGTATDSWIERTLRHLDKRHPDEDRPATLTDAQRQLNVGNAFWIMLGLQVPIIVAVICLLRRGESADPQPDPRSTYEDIDDMHPEAVRCKLSWPFSCWRQHSCAFLTIIILAGLLDFFADGIQAAYGGFIFSYGRLTIEEFTSAEAAHVNALFWGMFALGRLLSIFAALYLSPAIILFCDISGAMGALLLMLLVPETSATLYCGTALFGLCLSSICPSTIALVKQLIEIGPSATSCIVVAAATGEMLYPVVFGLFLNQFGPMSFILLSATTLSCMAIVFIALGLAGLLLHRCQATQNVFAQCCPRLFGTGRQEIAADDDSPIAPYDKLSSEMSAIE